MDKVETKKLHSFGRKTSKNFLTLTDIHSIIVKSPDEAPVAQLDRAFDYGSKG
jgi:hypothetical protein